MSGALSIDALHAPLTLSDFVTADARAIAEQACRLRRRPAHRGHHFKDS
jgi:hypothetical protein